MARSFAFGLTLIGGALALAGASMMACSANPGNGASGFGGGAGTQSTTGSNTGSGNSGTGSMSDSVGAGFAPSAGTTTGSDTGSGGGCAGTETTAMAIPLDIMVMLDQSGSMMDDAGGQSKWQRVTGALNSFVQQPGLDGIGLGIQYFGLPGAACNKLFCMADADCGVGCGPCSSGVCSGFNPGGLADSCDATVYDSAEVPIQPLPGVGPAITTSLSMHAPTTGTPTAPALEGALMYATQSEMANPSHVTVVAFATDGEPEACTPTDIPSIAAIAAQYYAATPSIKTFVIGVGSEVSSLNAIAQAGGTMNSFQVDSDPNANQEFLDAMNAIRGSALQCTYLVPTPTNGGTPDYGKVNVDYTPGNGGSKETIGKVANKAACGPNGGWYYDDDAAPTQIIMCDATCALLSGDSMGKVSIVLGCSTILN